MRATLLVVLLSGCASAPGLPHREQWELYSIQGLYSKIGCPGQRPYYVDVDGVQMFLECQ